jgi:ABC-type glycerol-3-phosphate transport system substrate-binding protein
MMRRLMFAAALIGVLGASVFAANIEIWMFGMANEYVKIHQELIEQEFTPKTGITVNVLAYPSEGFQNKVLLAMVSGDSPDIVTGPVDHIVEYGIRGSILPLRKVFPEKLAEIEPRLYSGAGMDHQGQGFGVVQYVGGIIGYQRTDILADLGVEYPTTWADLYEILPKLKAQGHEVAFGYGGVGSSPQWGAYLLMKQHGGGFVDTVTYRSLLNDPETIAGFKEFIELYTVHKMPQEITYLTMFRTGELAIFFDSVTAYASVDKGAPEIAGRWAYGLMPGTPRPDGTIDHQTFMAAQGLAISKDSKNKEAAMEFIAWLVSDDIQTRLLTELPRRMPGAMLIPGNKAALEAVPVRESDRPTLDKQLAVSTPFAYYPGAMSINRYVEFAVHEALQLGVTPEQALYKAHTLTEADLRQKTIEYERFIKNLL